MVPLSQLGQLLRLEVSTAAAHRLPDAATLAAALGGDCPVLLKSTLQASLERFCTAYHGDYPEWEQALHALPPVNQVRWHGEARVRLSTPEPVNPATLTPSLRRLMPWRKGPFDLFGLALTTEWRSDWKWNRIVGAGDWQGTRVLDVGCGNGYFGWRALAAGAGLVIGIDPTLLFCLQHCVINGYAREQGNWVLPLRCEELPTRSSPYFDRVLSLGVLYHRRDPLAHLRELYAQLRPGGLLILETLIVQQGPDLAPAAAEQRYANMRNVWSVPGITTLMRWLSNAGFKDIECLDQTPTTTEEQRATEWMTFQSLADWLDREDPSRTIEGLPAPCRAVLRATRPER